MLKSSPNFDQSCWDRRVEFQEVRKRQDEILRAHIEERSYQPECPTCHSKNVQRIFRLERGASIIGLGIFSKKINTNKNIILEESFMVGYCKKCGFIGAVALNKKCKNCGTKLNSLSEEMKQKYHIFNNDWSTLVFEIRRLDTDEEKNKRIEELLSRKDNFIKNEVSNNPLFSMEEYESQIKKDKENFGYISQYKENKINEQQPKNSTHNIGLHYCKKCGRLINVMPYNGVTRTTCDYCKSEIYPVPKEYLDKDVDCFFKDKETEEYFVENFVKTAPEFDEYLFNHRDSDLQQRWAKTEAALEHGKAVLEGRDKGNKFGVECPYCHSSNTKKITATSKAVHTTLFGIFSVGRNSKQFHCNNCNSDF